MYTTRGYRDGSTSISRFPIYVALPPCSVILFMKPHKAFSLFAFESSRGREFFHNFFLSAAQSVFGFVIQVWIYITSKLAFANKISAAISHEFKFSICSHKLEAGRAFDDSKPAIFVARNRWNVCAVSLSHSGNFPTWQIFDIRMIVNRGNLWNFFQAFARRTRALISHPTKRFLFIAPMQTKCVNRIGINWLRKFVPHSSLLVLF